MTFDPADELEFGEHLRTVPIDQVADHGDVAVSLRQLAVYGRGALLELILEDHWYEKWSDTSVDHVPEEILGSDAVPHVWARDETGTSLRVIPAEGTRVDSHSTLIFAVVWAESGPPAGLTSGVAQVVWQYRGSAREPVRLHAVPVGLQVTVPLRVG